jgi:hypothetical protein
MDVLMTLVVLGIPATVILVPLALRSWERRRILDAVMSASSAGQPVPAQLVETLISGQRDKAPQASRAERDRRRGTLLVGTGLTFVALGIALLAMLISVHVAEGVPAGIAVAALGLIPGLIGASYLWLAHTAKAA